MARIQQHSSRPSQTTFECRRRCLCFRHQGSAHRLQQPLRPRHFEASFYLLRQIPPSRASQNAQDFYKPWDANTPFENLIKQIQDCRDIAAAAGQPFSNEQILNAALHIVNQTGYYHDDVREWRKKPEADKTWPNFKAHFLKGKKKQNEEPTTANQAGYNAAAEATMAAAAEAWPTLQRRTTPAPVFCKN
jgi:hypothetical protein